MDEAPAPFHPTLEPKTRYGVIIIRWLFLAAAVLMLVAGLIGSELPASTGVIIAWVVLLAILAGITQPRQVWMPWINISVSAIGLLVFGGAAISRYHTAVEVVTRGFFIEFITLIFLVSLYLSMRILTRRESAIAEDFVL